MPVPFLLAGLVVAAGVIGAGGHMSAKETNEKAQRRSEAAQELYNNAKYSLEQAQNRTEKSLLKLGYEKKHVLDSSMHQFLIAYDKIKHIQLTESVGMNEISKFVIDQQGALELRQMTDIYSSSIKSGATGAAAGAAIVLATSGSLSGVTGGLATAGTAFMAGEVGAGVAGSALSFGAAMTPLAAIAAPVVLFTGISASIKADENLEKANTMYAEAEAASEKMKVSETLCGAITERADMFDKLLIDLNRMFAECAGLMSAVIQKKEGKMFKKNLSSEDFSENDLKLIAVTRSLAGAVKSVIDTPILSKDGNISYEADDMYGQTIEKLPNFNQAVGEIRSIDYGVKTKVIPINGVSSAYYSSVSGATVMGETRNIGAFVLGVILATLFAKGIANLVSDGYSSFLFLDSYVANKIAIWLLICTNVTIGVGRFKGSKIERWCGIGSGVALFILYVQYCRTVEMMNHYIIFSIIVIIAFGALGTFLDERKSEWESALYLSTEVMIVAIFAVLFLIYMFFSALIGFSEGFCLVVTSVLAFLISVIGFPELLQEKQ